MVIADDPDLTLNDYINLADEKMYSAKKLGRQSGRFDLELYLVSDKNLATISIQIQAVSGVFHFDLICFYKYK